MFKKAKDFYVKYERYLLPGTLILGLIVDFITFRTIQLETAFLILLGHLVLSGVVITFYNFYEAKQLKASKSLKYLRLASPLLIQFTFGALLSASFIFYWFSGAFSVSWPLILVLALLMIANDTFRNYYLRPGIQLSVYYFILFSILSLIFPFLFNSISYWVFLLSGAVSLVFMFSYIKWLSYRLDHISWLRKGVRINVILIFIFMNILYFSNIIPPIPLAIRDAGVYHSVRRVGGVYFVEDEDKNLLENLLPGEKIHKTQQGTIYVFSSIFAPADLSTRIVHHWQYYDSNLKRWISADKLSFQISGGRDDGYRGFSLKSAVNEGDWRVDVQTERGQVIGRINFSVEIVQTQPDLVELEK